MYKLHHTHIISARDLRQYEFQIIVCMLLTWKGNKIWINIFIQHKTHRSVLEDCINISNKLLPIMKVNIQKKIVYKDKVFDTLTQLNI
jgi:hypothetical protein